MEVEGGLYQGGRHQTLKGFLADSEKYLTAQVAGWQVLRIPGPWIAEGGRQVWREDVMYAVKHLLAVILMVDGCKHKRAAKSG